MPPKTIDKNSVYIDPVTGLIQVDGITTCKKVIRNGEIFLQFKDRVSISSRCRGTCFVEISLDEFVSAVKRGGLIL